MIGKLKYRFADRNSFSIGAILFFLFNFHIITCCAQNHVWNGSFEGFARCPYSNSDFEVIPGWYNPSNATPDCFSSICPFEQHGIIKGKNDFGIQPVKQGNSYVGIFLYEYNTKWREYVSTRLMHPLSKDSFYLVKLYVSRSEFSGYATNNLSILFTKDSIKSKVTKWLDYRPQLVSDSLITDSENWIELNFEYKAKGDETWMTIGNFATEESTRIYKMKVSKEYYRRKIFNGVDGGAYYFIDDVSITPHTRK